MTKLPAFFVWALATALRERGAQMAQPWRALRHVKRDHRPRVTTVRIRADIVVPLG